MEPGLAEPLIAGLPALQAEALFAIRHEQATTIEDVLAQRLRLALLSRDQGRAAAGTVAGLLAREHGWSEAQRAQALQAFETEVGQFAVPQ